VNGHGWPGSWRRQRRHRTFDVSITPNSLVSFIHMSPFSTRRTYFADRRVYPGKCRSWAVESNSDPRSLPLRGTKEPSAAATSPRWRR
jgi:hypothetical protein